MDDFGGWDSRVVDEEDPCPICHDELELDTQVKLGCGHIFHENVSRRTAHLL